MPLSWNEIKSRAVSFTKEWKDEVSEDAEAKSFWDEFFFIYNSCDNELSKSLFESHITFRYFNY